MSVIMQRPASLLRVIRRLRQRVQRRDHTDRVRSRVYSVLGTREVAVGFAEERVDY